MCGFFFAQRVQHHSSEAVSASFCSVSVTKSAIFCIACQSVANANIEVWTEVRVVIEREATQIQRRGRRREKDKADRQTDRQIGRETERERERWMDGAGEFDSHDDQHIDARVQTHTPTLMQNSIHIYAHLLLSLSSSLPRAF